MDYQDSTKALILRAGRVKILVDDSDTLDLYAEIQDLKRRVSAIESWR